jgi:hypothetical protein
MRQELRGLQWESNPRRPQAKRTRWSKYPASIYDRISRPSGRRQTCGRHNRRDQAAAGYRRSHPEQADRAALFRSRTCNLRPSIVSRYNEKRGVRIRLPFLHALRAGRSQAQQSRRQRRERWPYPAVRENRGRARARCGSSAGNRSAGMKCDALDDRCHPGAQSAFQPHAQASALNLPRGLTEGEAPRPRFPSVPTRAPSSSAYRQAARARRTSARPLRSTARSRPSPMVVRSTARY